MAATCHPRQPGSGHMAWLHRRQFRQDMQVHSRHEMWEHLLVVRSKQILTHWQVRQDAKPVEQCLWMQKKLQGHPAHSTIPVQYNMDNFNADGTVLNFAQRRPNTQLACWLKTSPGLRLDGSYLSPSWTRKAPKAPATFKTILRVHPGCGVLQAASDTLASLKGCKTFWEQN